MLSRVLVLRWAWQNRFDLARWARFARRLPTEVRTRDLDDLVTEARARITLSADPRTRSARDLDLTGFDNGTLIVQVPGEQPVAQLARDLLSQVKGVSDVRVVDRLPAVDDTVATPSPAPKSPAELVP